MAQMIEDFLKNEHAGNCPFPAMRALSAQSSATRRARTCDCAACVERVPWPCVGPSCTEVDRACAEVARCNQEINEMQAAYERELASCLATAVKAVSQGS